MTTPPKRFWLIRSAAVAVAVAAAAVWVFWPEPDPYPDQPEAEYAAAEAREFADVATMTASSALVVRGAVAEAGPGDTIELDDGSGAVQTNREVTIDVEEIIFNRYGVEEPKTVVMHEGYWENGVGFAREGLPWTEIGDSGYFYLTAPPPEHHDSGTYSLIHQNGRVLIDEAASEDVTVPGHWEEDGPWAPLGATAGAAAFEDEIRTAADTAEAGRVEPVTLTVCEPSDPENEDSEPICWEQ